MLCVGLSEVFVNRIGFGFHGRLGRFCGQRTISSFFLFHKRTSRTFLDRLDKETSRACAGIDLLAGTAKDYRKVAKRMSEHPAKDQVVYHKDGTLWAKGKTVNGVPTGYWEWFRKTGTKLRSGYFESGEQVGEWTTYDQAGKVYKVTTMKRKPKKVS